jgi:mono/diheme cytochrome c family protein
MQKIEIMIDIKKYYTLFFFVTSLLIFGGCKKTISDSGSLYTPTAADVTANATLSDLQQGRTLYLNNCGSCHGMYMPDNYSSSQWSSIMGMMGPKAQMSSSQIQLVFKYVSRGK